MGRRSKPSQPAASDPNAGASRKERRAAWRQDTRQAGSRPPGHWFAANRPILRFVVLFCVLVGGFNILFYVWLSHASVFDWYMNLNARVSAWVLRVFGERATADGTDISSPRYGLSLKRGCDAIQASAFFVFVVLASPLASSVRSRIPAILVGTAVLLCINLVRIISLYYTGVWYPNLFEMMHVEVWQALFIFLPLVFWIVWVRREIRRIGTPNVQT